MKNLKEKKLWEIAEKLYPRIGVDSWKTFADHAEINKGLITQEAEDFEMCLSLVQGAYKQDKLFDLLQKVVDLDNNDQGLRDTLNDLLNGYNDKLAKLASIIEKEQCILFLGPDILKIKEGGTISFNKKLIGELKNKLRYKTIYFDKNQEGNLNYIAQRFYKIDKTAPGQVGELASKLFKKYSDNGQVDDSVFRKLLNLPWKLIINTNPDNTLAGLMNDRIPGSCLERKYSFANNVDVKGANGDVKNTNSDSYADIQDIEKNNKSFFYNLFGTFDEDQSLSILYTESDFLEFISHVLAGKPQLHDYVNRLFSDTTKYYLFLGFDFDQWYFKIFARILNLNEIEERALSLNTRINELNEFSEFNECNIDFFEQKYKFYFVNDDVDSFLTKLTKSFNEISKK